MHLFNGAGKQITNISLTPVGESEVNIKAALTHRHPQFNLFQSFDLLPFDAHHRVE